jgi:predicted N-formylglutamate amidohydrolase
MFDGLVVTCEHATNRVPRDMLALFRDAPAVLESHRAYDAGALPVARLLARRLGAPLFTGQVSRLVVDLNRSEGHRQAFSEFVRDLPRTRKAVLLERYYRPYRKAVAETLAVEALAGHRVLHTSIHSFAPVLAGVPRNADVGILYDPARSIECRAADALFRSLTDSGFRVRRNYPYRGTADGLTTAMRRERWSGRYAGIEIELNQANLGTPKGKRRLADALLRAIRSQFA